MGRVTHNPYQLISDESAQVLTTSNLPDTLQNGGHIDQDLCDKEQSAAKPLDTDFVPAIRWPDLIAQIFLHVGAIYGICFLPYVSWWTILWSECRINIIAEI